MKTWYAAHLVLYVEKKTKSQRRFPVWENIVLIQANSEEEAIAKAEAQAVRRKATTTAVSAGATRRRAGSLLGSADSSDVRTRKGDLATARKSPTTRMEFASRDAIERFVQGQTVRPITSKKLSRSRRKEPLRMGRRPRCSGLEHRTLDAGSEDQGV